MSDELDAVAALRAPVLIVTPHGFGLGGKQPRGGTLSPITRPLAAELARGLPLAKEADGNALARTAMVAIRRLAAAGGHPLPKRIPPAEHNLKGILGTAASRDPETPGGPWLIAAVLGGTALLLARCSSPCTGARRASSIPIREQLAAPRASAGGGAPGPWAAAGVGSGGYPITVALVASEDDLVET